MRQMPPGISAIFEAGVRQHRPRANFSGAKLNLYARENNFLFQKKSEVKCKRLHTANTHDIQPLLPSPQISLPLSAHTAANSNRKEKTKQRIESEKHRKQTAATNELFSAT